MITRFISRNELAGSKVDREAGIIRGVSLIALGDARGHKKAVDQKTLETVRDCAKEYGKLRVKFNPQTFNHGNGSLAGYIPAESLHISDGKTLGDIHLYKNFDERAKEYLYEIAEETPKNIGLSIEFSGDDEVIDKENFARCEEIFTATIVDLPAANPSGLFAAVNLTKDEQELNPSSTNGEPNETMDEKTIQALTAGIVAGVTEAFKPVADAVQKLSEKSQDTDDDKEEMSAAGVTDEDDEDTKKDKVAKYRASKANVTAMSRGDLEKVVSETATKTFMQCFRQTGGKPAKVSPTQDDGVKDFEALVKEDIAAGGVTKGHAITRMRKKHPAEYNAFMASKHPNVQHMAAK